MQTVYVPVKASEEKPESWWEVHVQIDLDDKPYTSDKEHLLDHYFAEQITWLKPIQAVLLSKEDAERMEATTKQQDEIIGRLTRKVEFLQDSQTKRNEWLQKAKQQAGFNNDVSFDRVWEVALEAYLEKLSNQSK